MLARPEENDVTGKVTMCKLQTDNGGVKRLRRLGIGDRQMCFIKMHACEI